MEQEDSDTTADSTPPLIEVNAALSQFIENMGLHYQDYGLARISGRIIGLLLVTPRPITSEEMAEALSVSRSSISTNLRTLQFADLVEKVAQPGERVDYYALTANPWQRALEERLETIISMRDVAKESLSALETGHPAGPRLSEMIEWVNGLEELLNRFRLDWRPPQEELARSG